MRYAEERLSEFLKISPVGGEKPSGFTVIFHIQGTVFASQYAE
jgi:hypothetical protein